MAWIGLVLLGVAWMVGLPAAAASRVVIRTRYTAADQERMRYAYVPFTVPVGTTRVRLSYRYDRAGGDNAVDFGVYEPGSLDLGTPALRGWSGGARDTVEIGLDAASPGYWPGPLPSGEWHAVLGLYKVASVGVDVDVTIECLDTPPTAPLASGSRSSQPTRQGAQWYVGVLHTHTVHSDGALTPEQLVHKAAAERLDFIAITDHNNTTHQLANANAPGMLVITGEEVTTPFGHFNVLGLGGVRDYVDFRLTDDERALGRVMRGVRDRGAVLSINHPVSDCLACSWTRTVPAEVSAIEIANGSPDARRQAMVVWDSLLRAGRRLTAVDGSDWHRGDAPLAQPAVRIWARELSTRAVLDGLRRGQVVVVADGRLPAPELLATSNGTRATVGDTLPVSAGDGIVITLRASVEAYADARIDILWNGEVVSSAPLGDGLVMSTRYPTRAGYLRAHLVAPDGSLLAITNPVFVTMR